MYISNEEAVYLTALQHQQYGGDVSRKMKLLQKQKEGKKRMKMIGKIYGSSRLHYSRVI